MTNLENRTPAFMKEYFLSYVNQMHLRDHFPEVPEEFWQSLEGREGTLEEGNLVLFSVYDSSCLAFRPSVNGRILHSAGTTLIHWKDLDLLLQCHHGICKRLKHISFHGGHVWNVDAFLEACCNLIQNRLSHAKTVNLHVSEGWPEGRLEQILQCLPPGLRKLELYQGWLKDARPQLFQHISLLCPHLDELSLQGYFDGSGARFLVQSMAHSKTLELGKTRTDFRIEETDLNQLGEAIASHPKLETCCFRNIKCTRAGSDGYWPVTFGKATQDAILARLSINRAKAMLQTPSLTAPTAGKKRKLEEPDEEEKSMNQRKLFVETMVASRHNVGAIDYLLTFDPVLFATAGLEGAKGLQDWHMKRRTREAHKQYTAKLAEEEELEKKEQARVFYPNGDDSDSDDDEDSEEEAED